jgi:hypothetical protein
MMPAFPFIAGLILGAAAVAGLRSERGRAAISSAGSRLRDAVGEAERGVRAAAESSGLARFRCAPETAPETTAPAEPPSPAGARKPKGEEARDTAGIKAEEKPEA